MFISEMMRLIHKMMIFMVAGIAEQNKNQQKKGCVMLRIVVVF